MAIKRNTNDKKEKKTASVSGEAMTFKTIVVLMLTAAANGFKNAKDIIMDITVLGDGSFTRKAGNMVANPVVVVEEFMISLATVLLTGRGQLTWGTETFSVDCGTWFNDLNGKVNNIKDAVDILGATFTNEAWADQPQKTPLYKVLKQVTGQRRSASATAVDSASAPDLAALIAAAVAEALKNQ